MGIYKALVTVYPEAVFAFEDFIDEYRFKKVRRELRKFNGISCTILVGEYNEFSGEFESFEKFEVNELVVDDTSEFTISLFDGDQFITLATSEHAKRVYVGDSVIFNGDTYGEDIMITYN